MVERKEYLDQLWAWKDEQQIEVLTGAYVKIGLNQEKSYK